MDLRDSISDLRGIGPKKAQRLSKLGICSVEDLVYHFPRTYQDRRQAIPLLQLEHGVPALTKGIVTMVVKEATRYKRRQILRILVEDSGQSGEPVSMEVVFFHANYLEHQFIKGETYFFYGTPKIEWGKRQMIFPEFFSDTAKTGNQEACRILPIYPLTCGISQGEIRKLLTAILQPAFEIPEYLPQNVMEKSRLCCLDYAIRKIHFPQDKEELKAAKYRLIFDELYLLQIGLMLLADQNKSAQTGLQMDGNVAAMESKLPFHLTNAQKRVMAEISKDMGSGKRMNRLIQGDVGSGKTVLAALALYKAVDAGYQGVFMAPTELLAKQHEKSFKSQFQGLCRRDGKQIQVALLTGGMKVGTRADLLCRLSTGDIDILIGTHALIQPDVIFSSLGLVVTDEQHRFGVEQRMRLNQKAVEPHILVMTATPIPRTLAVVVFGDMDISVLDEKPAGRQDIITKVTDACHRSQVYEFVKDKLKTGQQVYVVTPLIEESETLDIKSVEQVFAQLELEFSDTKVACLHGDMPRQKKDAIMQEFGEGHIQVLVSTVVIEVGIDVPNATVMVIENAERFGLAQLHQLRGRVGRGQEQSYCILISEGSSSYAKQRAEIMAASNDGFYIAEKDLELRGPGEFFGTRQHGLPELKLADLIRHTKILEQAKTMAQETLADDPNLDRHSGLKSKTNHLFERGLSL